MKKTVIALISATLLMVTFAHVYAAEGATLALETEKDTYAVGDTFTVQVLLDTAGATTDEVDVSISYDPTKLEVQDGIADLDDDQIPEDTSLLEVYLENVVDTPNGTIFFEQTSLDPNAYYTTTDEPEVLAEFQVRALDSGTAEMKLVLTEGDKDTDSSVKDADTHEDLLAEVTNLALTIEGEAETADTETAAAGTLDSLTLQANKTLVTADGADTVTFTVMAQDENSEPVSGEALLFSASNDAQLSELTGTTDAKGEATFTMTAPSDPGTVQVQVFASSDASLTAMQNITVEAAAAPEVMETVDTEVDTPAENVSSGPDTLDSVGAGSIFIMILGGFALLMAYGLHLRKQN